MPGMSGVELQSLLIAQARGMPVVFITAFPNEGIRAQVLASGAIGYLSKPLDGDTLVQCLTAAFKKNDEETVAGSNAEGQAGGMGHADRDVGTFLQTDPTEKSQITFGPITELEQIRR